MSPFVMVRAPQIPQIYIKHCNSQKMIVEIAQVQRIQFYLIIRTNIVATETIILFSRRTHTASRKYTDAYTTLIKTASMPLYLKDTS